MGIVYNKQYAKNYKAWFESPKGRFAFQLEKKLIKNIVPLKRNDKVLDVGCGIGVFSQVFKNIGAEVTGIEISEEMLNVALEAPENKGIKFIPGSAYELPFPDNSFDLVTLITVLEFLDDPRKAITEAFRVSKGKVFVGILNRRSPIALRRKMSGKEVWKKAHFFTLNETINLLGKNTKIKWQGTLYLPLINSEARFQFRLNVEEFLSRFKFPFAGFIGILAEFQK